MLADDPLRPHRHDPNPEPPDGEPAFEVFIAGEKTLRLSPADLRTLPRSAVKGMFISSTGHSASGPFTFGGVALRDVVRHVAGSETDWSQVEIIGGDGFGTRVAAAELADNPGVQPLLLGDEIDGRPMSRAEGLVRLVVPTELDDALRQVKWVRAIRIVP